MTGKTILVIDDDETIRESLSVFIEGLGYRTETKKDTTSAKKWLSANKPDLILLDVMLPDGDGIGFCHWISSQENI